MNDFSENVYRTKLGEIGIHKSTYGVYMNGNADVSFWISNGLSKCSKLSDLEIVSLDSLTEKELEEYEVVKRNKRY
jgi:hypothetical protein